MKKYLVLTTIVALFFALPTQAGIPGFNYGVKAGVNLSKISFSDSSIKPDNYTGFQVGPMVEFMIPVVGFGVDAALLYSQTGFKLNGKAYKNGNLLVPVNLKYKLSLASLAGVFITAGPYANFKLSGDDFDAQAKAKTFGAGLNFGLGAELLSHLQVGVNYQLGLTDNYKEDGALGAVQNAFTNSKVQVWSITAAYFF